MKHILTALILILCLAAAVLVPAAAEEDSPARPLVERIVVSHAADGTRDEQALAALAALDPSLGEKWTRIMDLWETPVTGSVSS